MLAVALAALAAAPAAHATFPGKPGPIVFFNLDGRDDQTLYSISPSGGRVRDAAVDGRWPAYSADGERIAHAADGTIWVAEADGENPRAVARAAADPVWSPDGRELVITRTNIEEDSPYMEVLTIETGATRFLAGGETPSWSPDGRLIVYSLPNGIGLCTIRPDGTHKRCPSSSTNSDAAHDPDFSPGGRAIVAAVHGRVAVFSRGMRFARWISPPIGKTKPPSTRVFNPSWSPDGRRVVYERGKGFNRGSLYVTGDRGGRQRYLTGGTAPVWSPRP